MSDPELASLHRAVAGGELASADVAPAASVIRLRLYIARSTPNSTRAEHNLLAALDRLGDWRRAYELDIVDVFTHPKRAIADGVIVTPTLIGIREKSRLTMMGDLTDGDKLVDLLRSLGVAAAQP